MQTESSPGRATSPLRKDEESAGSAPVAASPGHRRGALCVVAGIAAAAVYLRQAHYAPMLSGWRGGAAQVMACFRFIVAWCGWLLFWSGRETDEK